MALLHGGQRHLRRALDLIDLTAEQQDLVTRLKSEADSVLEDIRRAKAGGAVIAGGVDRANMFSFAA